MSDVSSPYSFEYGDHICSLYRAWDEQFEVIGPYIREGLSRGDCCVYVVDERPSSHVLGALRESGVDTEEEQGRGALMLLRKKDVYLRRGRFDPTVTFSLWMEMVQYKLAAGFKGVRAAGDMSWAQGPEPGCDRWREYEEMADKFKTTMPTMGLCQFNQGHFSQADLEHVRRTHAKHIINGRQSLR